MKTENFCSFIWTVSLATVLFVTTFAFASTRELEPGKLREAWLRLEICREAAVTENQDAKLERCLATALPMTATALEKMKVVEFLLLDLKPSTIFECPSRLSEARGE